MRTHVNAFKGIPGMALYLALPAQLAAQADFPPTVPPDSVDLAVRIVMGEIVRIEQTTETWGSKVRLGKAVVLVKEVLKGPPSSNLSFITPTWTDPSYNPPRPLKVHTVGMKGIWMVASNGWAVNSGPMPESYRKDVLQTLKKLEERTWSDESHGLKLWAGLWKHDDWRGKPFFFVALKNVSDAPIYYPSEQALGILSAVARASDQTVHGRPPFTWEMEDPIFCRRISPGETIYLQTGKSVYFDWDRADGKPGDSQPLPPGRYHVEVTFQNGRNGCTYDGPGRRVPVSAWKGELHAPSLELILDPPVNSR